MEGFSFGWTGTKKTDCSVRPKCNGSSIRTASQEEEQEGGQDTHVNKLKKDDHVSINAILTVP